MIRQPAPTGFLSTLSLRRATSAPRFTPAASRNFYPRSPCGERQSTTRILDFNPIISIHALLAESDGNETNFPRKAKPYFYPRSPCGERLFLVAPGYKSFRFLSTLSLRRATNGSKRQTYQQGISIHALLAESDGRFGRFAANPPYFYPRSPCGERPRTQSASLFE